MATIGTRLSRRVGREVRARLPERYRRRLHLFGVGMAKSGTHSVAALFARHYRAAHEPDAGELIGLLLGGTASEQDMRRYLLTRDRRRTLEVDSSQLNFFLVDHLAELFPAAKFLLTIRHPYDWLESAMNHELERDIDARWRALQDLRLGCERSSCSYPLAERGLRERGLYPIDAYLGYWSHHNGTLLSKLPADRLLVIRTDQIEARMGDIADFAGVPRQRLEQGGAHAYKALSNQAPLAGIERAYVEARVRHHCGELIDWLWPSRSAA